MRTASAVGAETDTITGAPMAVLFCTISADIRLVRSMIPSLATVCARRPRCVPRHHHGAGIRKPSQQQKSLVRPLDRLVRQASIFKGGCYSVFCFL
jgi:hypothetical protein